jgi:hypothetical protein
MRSPWHVVRYPDALKGTVHEQRLNLNRPFPAQPRTFEHLMHRGCAEFLEDTA